MMDHEDVSRTVPKVRLETTQQENAIQHHNSAHTAGETITTTVAYIYAQALPHGTHSAITQQNYAPHFAHKPFMLTATQEHVNV